MAKIIDISKKITNELPTIKITEDIIVSVNNRKSTILNIQCMVQENARKAEDNEEEYDEFEFMDNVLKMIIGEKKSDEINALDLPLPEYKAVYETIFNVATGAYGQDTPIE